MAITSRTGEFHKLREDFNRMAASPEGLSNERIEAHLRDKDVDLEEFKSAWKEFSAAGMKADSPGFALGRIPGRAIGDTVEGIIDIGAAIAPQFIEDAVEKVADTVGAKIPDSVKRASAELMMADFLDDSPTEPTQPTQKTATKTPLKLIPITINDFLHTN